MQIIAIVVSLAITVVGVALLVRAVRDMVRVIRLGQPALNRTDDPAARTVVMLKETLGHTRMLKWTLVGAAHWFVFIGFGLLFFTLVTAYGQLFDAHFLIPFLGSFFLWEWITELVTVVMIAAIIGFIIYRSNRPTERVRGKRGRFFGSTMWQGYFVELVILGVGLCIFALRGLEHALMSNGTENADHATAFHFPLTFWLGEALSGLSVGTLENLIYLVAAIKIVISLTWMIVISLHITMGVAWHRFLAFPNIWFKRESSGGTALGAMKPLTSGGEKVSLDDLEDIDEDTALGVGKVEDFSWKGLLDFNTCTECGRCQSQCPAWNTDKPLSPKLMVLGLRDHAFAKAPYLQAGGDGGGEAATALLERDETVAREANRPLVGDTGDEWFYMPENGTAVIDEDVLWACTSCGACVEQCPVDIEHVDHIMDMRRHQVLVEANFPAELNQLFKGLENKGNPWNMSASARMEWAQDLDFDVPVLGEDVEDIDEVEWLFWVGCAGAYEDRAKKTTRAVAELLTMAGVKFAVLGNGETCTGDPARRAGNEFVFQGLASQNAETLKEHRVKKVVSTCAHCFNTLKNEYGEFGVELEVTHHTQLLNRLVREGRLTPIKDGEGASKRSITYHDPCFLGRHNQVYSPPRDLLQVLPGAEYAEMERNSERSFCCGAGGARMWMEEKLGERINVNRTKEAVGTGADQIATGCPFCRVMLSDGLTAEQSSGDAREEVEVLDVAQMLLASVKGESATKLKPGAGAGAGGSPAAAAGGAAAATAVATKAEPDAGDETQTEDTVTDTEDTGPAAKASGGSSLFDTPAPEAESAGVAQKESPKETGGGSLFDMGGQESQQGSQQDGKQDTAGTAEPAPATGGGSLFDLGGDEPAEPKAAEPEPEPEPESEPEPEASGSAEPAEGLGSGGSLFDLEAPEPTKSEPGTKPEPEAKAEPPASEPQAATPPASVPETGSLFDIEAAGPQVSDAATRAATEASEEAPPAESAPEDEEAPPAESAPEDEEAEAEEPASDPAGDTGRKDTHQPRQDADIPEDKEGGSLFDL